MVKINEKISVRQASLIMILAIVSPIIRILASYADIDAKEASWLSPIVSVIPFVILIFVIHELFKKNKNKSLGDVFCLVLGNTFGKIVMAIYAIWIFFFLSLNTRNLGERFEATIYPYSPIEIFIATVLLVAFIVTRNKIEYFARAIEVMFLILMGSFLLSFILLLPEVKLEHLYPVTTDDIVPVIKSTVPILSTWSYFIYVFFLGHKISDKNNIKKVGIKAGIILAVICLGLTIITVGVFGYNVNQLFVVPYFIALKEIDILNKIYGMESIFLSLLMILDFAAICIYVYIIYEIIKKIFNGKISKQYITPIIFSAYVFSLYIANNRFEMETFNKIVGINVNLVLGVLIPIIVLIIGKIRKKV